jgi:hypothetical protein
MAVTVLTTVTQAANNYDLTDLPTAKDELSIKTLDTSNDPFLKRAISQASALISNYCNRVFQVESISETIYIDQDPYPYQVPGGVQPLQLSRWPLFAVASVKQVLSATVTNTLVAGRDYKVIPATGLLIRLNAFSGIAVTWEPWPVIVDYTAGFSANPVQAATIPVGPGPYIITVKNAATFAFDQGVTLSDATPLVNVPINPASGQYSVDQTTGIYTFNAANAGLGVNINYVYTNIPLDLVVAALRVVTLRFKQRGRDPLLTYQQQPNLGEQKYWAGNLPGQIGGLPPEITGMLDGTYRVPCIV